MKKQSFTDVLQNRCSYKFPDIQKKIPALKSLFNKVNDLKACNFNKKRDKRFPVNITKFLRSFFMAHLRWLLLNRVEEFLRTSNSSWICTEEFIKQ